MFYFMLGSQSKYCTVHTVMRGLWVLILVSMIDDNDEKFCFSFYQGVYFSLRVVLRFRSSIFIVRSFSL